MAPETRAAPVRGLLGRTYRGRLVTGTLMALLIIVDAGVIGASHQQQQAYEMHLAQQRAEQAAQGRKIEHKLCATFDRIASLRPPPGNPATNPSRAYDQKLHALLGQVGPADLGCPPAG